MPQPPNRHNAPSPTGFEPPGELPLLVSRGLVANTGQNSTSSAAQAGQAGYSSPPSPSPYAASYGASGTGQNVMTGVGEHYGYPTNKDGKNRAERKKSEDEKPKKLRKLLPR